MANSKKIKFQKGFLPEVGFLRLPQVLQFIPVSPSSWWQGVREGRFPKPVPIGKRTSVYKAEDIRALIEKINSGEGV